MTYRLCNVVVIRTSSNHLFGIRRQLFPLRAPFLAYPSIGDIYMADPSELGCKLDCGISERVIF